MKKKLPKMTILELEQLLQQEEDVELEILPNGNIIRHDNKKKTKEKPLTMKERLGGEYSEAA